MLVSMCLVFQCLVVLHMGWNMRASAPVRWMCHGCPLWFPMVSSCTTAWSTGMPHMRWTPPQTLLLFSCPTSASTLTITSVFRQPHELAWATRRVTSSTSPPWRTVSGRVPLLLMSTGANVRNCNATNLLFLFAAKAIADQSHITHCTLTLSSSLQPPHKYLECYLTLKGIYSL